MAFWDNLSAVQQDSLLLFLYILPASFVGALVLFGFRPFALVRAMLWRFRWANLLFVLLIAISVGIGVGLLAQERGLRRGTAAASEKFDLVIAAPGSEMTMLLATVFLQPADVPLLSGEVYDRIAGHEHVDLAAPLAFGDSYFGASVIGTTSDFVNHLSDGQIVGSIFAHIDEAVAGALAPVAIGDEFVPAHGHGDAAEDRGHDAQFTVVGQMPATGTPWDRSILVPIEAVWEVHDLGTGHGPEVEHHDEGHEDHDAGHDDHSDHDAHEPALDIGPPFDPEHFPGTPAIIVHADELWANYALRSEFASDPETMAFFPGAVLSQLYRVMGDIRQVMSVMSLTTQVLVAASVLVGLLILIRLFQRQLALLMALGAPTRFVFAVVWSYAAILLISGAGIGLVVGQGTTWVLSQIVTRRTDILVQAPLGWPEVHFVAIFVSTSTLIALLPAFSVLRQHIISALRS